jgi:hypothetical protein
MAVGWYPSGAGVERYWDGETWGARRERRHPSGAGAWGYPGGLGAAQRESRAGEAQERAASRADAEAVPDFAGLFSRDRRRTYDLRQFWWALKWALKIHGWPGSDHRGRMDTGDRAAPATDGPGEFDAFGADIAYGRSYTFGRAALDAELEGWKSLRDHWVIREPSGGVAARLPGAGGGIARTRDESWYLTIERRGVRWQVAARTHERGRAVGTIVPTMGPAYKLELQTGSGRTAVLRLGPSWVTARWVLRLNRQAVGYISRHAGSYEIEVASQAHQRLPIGLLTVLAAECVLVHSALPNVPSGG